MATSAATLVTRCRRFLQDWGDTVDALTASTSSSGTLTVADATIYAPNWLVQVGTEGMLVVSGASTTLTTRRGFRGTTAVTHASADQVMVRPHFLDLEYLDALNAAIDACYPLIYQSVVDETIATTASTYEYTIPNLNSVPINAITGVWFKESGDLTFRRVNSWDILRGSTPKLKFRHDLGAGGTVRLLGFSPIPPLADLSASLNALFPVNAEDALTYYACQHLLVSGESFRVREDTGPKDNRESANKTGSSLSASNAVYQRFLTRLSSSAMPPMPRQVVSVL